MEIKQIPAHSYSVSDWAGGSTTQLLIYPAGSQYQQRDFLFRISSATVTCPQSEFTPLPGVERVLMVLEGQLELRHGDGRQARLGPYEQDSFSGGVGTTSLGQARDFNLMLRQGADGSLEALAGGQTCLTLAARQLALVYCAQGDWRVGDCNLPQGDSALLAGPGQVTLVGPQDGRMVCARVQLPGEAGGQA